MDWHAHIRERVHHLVHILADRALRHTRAGRLLHYDRGASLDAGAGIRALVTEEHATILAGEHWNRLRVQALGLQRLGHILGLDHRCFLGVFIGDAGGDGRRIRQRLTTPYLGTIRQECGHAGYDQRQQHRHQRDNQRIRATLARRIRQCGGCGRCAARRRGCARSDRSSRSTRNTRRTRNGLRQCSRRSRPGLTCPRCGRCSCHTARCRNAGLPIGAPIV